MNVFTLLTNWRSSRFDSVSTPCRCRVLAILLLCLTLGVGNVWGTTTYSLTQVSSVSAGNKYVIVHDGYAVTTVSSKKLQSTNSYSTSGLAGNEAYVFLLESATGGYYLKNCSLKSNQYLNNSDGTDMSNGSSSSVWTFNFTSNVALIQNSSNSNRFLGETSSSSHEFKAYATSNLNSYDHNFSVYRLDEESSCSGTKLGTPVVTATPSSGQIVLTWPNVANASSYQLKWNGGDWTSATSPVTKTSLTNGTSYSYQVKAIGNGTTYCDGDASASASSIPGTYYTVTWKASGSSDVTTSVRSGTKPTFPDTLTSCDDVSTTFIGWSTSTWSGKIDDISDKTIYTSADDMPNVSGAVTYYAVFAKAGAANTYVKGTSSDLTDGQTVIIVNNNSSYALSSEDDEDGYLVATSVSITSNTITSPAAALIWTVELGTNDGYYFKHGDNYINAYYSSYYDTHHLYFDDTPDEWTLTGSGPYVLNSTEDSGQKLYYWSEYSCWDVYTGTGNPYNTDFYVPAAPSQYLTNCCTALGTINGSVSWSNAATAVVSWDNIDHVSSWTVKYKTHAAGAYTTWAGDQSTAAGRRSVTITGLTPCTDYDFQIIANPASGYCDKDQTIEDSQTHNWTVTKTGVTNVTAASLSAIPATTCSGFGPITITAADGYVLPAEITVSGASHTWNQATGALTISSVTGNVSITITPAEESCPDQYTFAYGETADGDGKNITDATRLCFSQVDATTEYQITGFTIPTTTQYFWVGYNGYYYDSNIGPGGASNKGSERNQFKYLHVTALQGQTCSNDRTGEYLQHAQAGAYGTLRIYSNYNDKNLYVGFVPAGYQMRIGSGDSWTNVQLTQDGSSWTSGLVTLDAATVAKKYYINVWTGSSYSSSDEGVAINNWTDGNSTISSMVFKTGADTWNTTSGLSAGMRGKFRTWTDNCVNNGYCHFVPYYQLQYNPASTSGTGTGSMSPLPASPVSCEESAANRTVTVATSSFTAPQYKQFDHWNTAADNSGSNVSTGSYTLTSDVTLYAQWAYIPVTALTLNHSTLKRYVGESDVTLSVTGVTPAAANPAVNWSSSDATVASVDGGVVSFLKAGTATITATSTISGGVTATCSVEVRSISSPTMQDETGTAISTGVNKPSVTWTLGTRTLTANEGTSNYKFKRWIVTNATPASTTNLSTTLGDPTGNVTVVAEFYKPRTVKWSVNGNDSYNTGGPTTEVAYNGTISTIPTAPSGLVCASTFVAWTDAAHNNGTTAKTSTSYYESKLFTAANQFPNITAETTTFYAVFAEGTGAAVNTVMWSEDWTGATSSSGSGTPSPSDARPSAQGDHSGKTVYGGATITYTDGTGTYVRTNENNAGGTAPELLIKGNENWTISGIPTGGAATLTLEYRTNGTLTVSTSTDNVSIGTKSGSNPYTNTITVGSGVTSFNLSFTQTSNRRIDNVSVKVASVNLTNYVTECDANIVSVTYDANGGSTSCTNTTTDKTEDFSVCSSVPTRDYYTFAGWLCSADDEVYQANATIDADAIDADFTLTAQWTPVPYDITYELDGGTNSGSNPATYNVTTATITLQNPTRDHDRFDGWYDNGSFTGDAVTSIPLGSHGDITLYAKWAERHEIIFDADGATTTIYRADDEDLSASVAEQGSVPSDPSAPTACSSKVFVGWSESEIDDETDDEPADLMKPAAGTVDEDKEYYAVWALRSGTPIAAVEDNSFTTSGTETYCGMTNGMKQEGDYILKNNIWTSSNMSNVQVKIKVYHLSNNKADVLRISLVNSSGEEVVGTDLNTTAKGSNSSAADYSSYVTLTPTSAVTGYKVALKTINSNGTCVDKVTREVVAQTSAYSTSCCATKVTLSQNDPEHGTIVFGKTSVGTCGGDKEVSLTITPAAGYQLHSYEVATGSGKVAAKSVSPAISLDNNNSAAQNITLTFAEDANGAYDVTASFTEMVASAWAWTKHVGGATITTDPVEVYVGQKVQVDVAYEPAGLLSNHTNASAYNYSPSPWSNPNLGSPAKAGDHLTVTGTNAGSTSVVLNHNDGLTKTINYTVLALPLVHFVDNIHGETFANVVATVSGDQWTVTTTLPTPTHSDVSDPGASYNTCERQHLHLLGWIESTWADAHPNAEPGDITGAGAGNYYAAGADIDLVTQNNKTFYAVWTKIE